MGQACWNTPPEVWVQDLQNFIAENPKIFSWQVKCFCLILLSTSFFQKTMKGYVKYVKLQIRLFGQ